MRKFEHPELSSSKFGARAPGFSLVELLVVLVILSILATVALPFAEVTVRRTKELDLRRALRSIRGAIERLHEDWESGRIAKSSGLVSKDGFPKSLFALVEGVPTGDAKKTKRKYLRRIPRDPFASPSISTDEQWALRGYEDDYDSETWNGEDVFDVRSNSDLKAIDGTQYKNW